MANTSLLQGDCIAPFLDASLFPQQGGFIGGRLCVPISELPGDPICCLPCPATDWTYADSFQTYGTVAGWLNVVGLILMAFMLLSYIVLPAQQTRSHYLSVCLILAVGMIAIGFTIPLAAHPEQCYNDITPNDMYSSMECAWSGAFIIAGGLSAGMWIFVRALSMNLQICWDIVPGKKFFYFSQAFGWGIPAVLFTATMTVTGVSFRFGNACHVNHSASMADFWGPLLAIAGAAGILQLTTFSYCVHVYLKSLRSDMGEQSSSNASGSNLPSYSGSVRTQTARAVWRRLKKVLWLQWRGICIVTIILVDVIFFSIVFVYLDNLQSNITTDFSKVEPWLGCLALHPTDKNACLDMVSSWLVNEPMVVAVLLLLSLAGVQVFLFLTRPSVFPAWVALFKAKFTHRQEFISLDARPHIMRSNSKHQLLRSSGVHGGQNVTFEMQKRSELQKLSLDLDGKILSPTQTILSSPDDAYLSPLADGRGSISPSLASLRNTRTRATFEDPERKTLDTFPMSLAAPPPGVTSPSPPAVSYNAVSLHRQPSDYFSRDQTYARYNPSISDAGRVSTPNAGIRSTVDVDRPVSQQRPESQERHYFPPHSSFSAPITPSRHNSLRSVTFDLRDTYSRGGLALNPPSEAGESQEDLTPIDARPSMNWR